MTAPLLSLVPIDAHREPEQLMLQPVALILPFLVPEPWLVRCARRRTAKAGCAAVPPAAQASPYPGDLETYRAPRRPPALHPYAPRRQRPGARPRSMGRVALSAQERRQLARDEAKTGRLRRRRPRTWGDCEGGSGPCPWVSCSMHLYLDVDPDTGIIKLNFPDKQPHELAETCALRVVRDRHDLSLDQVGKLINLTQERVSQIEETGLKKTKKIMEGNDE